MAALDSFWWSARLLWTCRVSVLSAAAGLLLFGGVVQAQNLLADTSWNSSSPLAVLYWTSFFLALFVFWAFPVHYGARTTLDDPSWILTAHLRTEMGGDEADRFCRRAARKHERSIIVVPRVLGMLPFVAVALGLWGASDAVLKAGDLNEGREAMRLIRWLAAGDALTALAFLLFVVFRRAWVRSIARRLDRDRSGAARRARGADLLTTLATACIWLTLGMFFIAYAFPVLLSLWVPRALMVPALLGSLVLPLSWVARQAHAKGVPYIFLLVLGCLLVTGSNRHFHDLRTLAGTSGGDAPVARRQMDLADAVDRWKAANGCAGGGAPTCPPALIVAAEGGASRAAFMAATTVGAILDRMDEVHDDPALRSPGRRIFAISGVSGGAFGAAVIQAALADAEADGRAATRATPPCRRAPRSWFRAPAAWLDPGMVRSSWRYCLQALTSGDYLSTTFVGLAFRDAFAPPLYGLRGPNWLDDRAALLEEAWERHYDAVTQDSRSPFDVGSACGTVSNRGFCRRFGYAATFEVGTSWVPLLLLNGTSVQTGRRVIASDIASTRAGSEGEGPQAIYPEAYDLFEATGTARCPRGSDQTGKGSRCVVGPPAAGPDFRLSTAALASARFPIVSPAGRYGPANSEAYGDRVVDGGYFENAGLTTAHDLADALSHQGIKALILWVANEPERAFSDVVEPIRPARTPGVGPADDNRLLVRAFGLLVAPLQAIYDTREGHGAEAASHAGPDGETVFRVGVFAAARLTPDPNPDPADLQRCQDLEGKSVEMTQVSMSWWLSPAVQADLDVQLCDQINRNVIRQVIHNLGERR